MQNCLVWQLFVIRKGIDMFDYKFDVQKITEEAVEWIRNFFVFNGNGCNAVIGISGGKDSSVVAALCVEALGKDRVIGVMMPDNRQDDIDCSYKLCQHLGIKHIEVNIGCAVSGIIEEMKNEYVYIGEDACYRMLISKQTLTNLPARIRMSTLYAISQSCNGRVANTCNLSEDWIGWSTRYGDAAGDFAPIAGLTSDEVVAVGEYLGLPEELTRKVPSDGLTGSTDEDNFGFTYEVLNKYLRTGVCNEEVKNKIDTMHQKNQFKMEMMPSFHSHNLFNMLVI